MYPIITAFAPNIDNYALSENAGTAFQNGQQMKVPLLAGFNSDEQAVFLPYGLSKTSTTMYQEGLLEYFGPRALEALMLYPTLPCLTALSMHYHTARFPTSSIWAYYFTYTSPYSPAAIHTAEIPFVFGNLGQSLVFGPAQAPPSSSDVAFSRTLMGYWTNFAKIGNPNGNGLPVWPAYTGGGSGFLQLGNTIAPVTYNLSRFQFLASFRLDDVLPQSWKNVNMSDLGN
jgi:para-nitrobenzyl esterase